MYRSAGTPQSQHGGPWRQHGCPWRQHGDPWREHGCPWRQHGTPWREHGCPWRQHGDPWREHGTPWREHAWVWIGYHLRACARDVPKCNLGTRSSLFGLPRRASSIVRLCPAGVTAAIRPIGVLRDERPAATISGHKGTTSCETTSPSYAHSCHLSNGPFGGMGYRVSRLSMCGFHHEEDWTGRDGVC